MCPGNVWGKASGALVDAGVQNPDSKLIPLFLMLGARRNAASMLGLGKNIWVHVSIDDREFDFNDITKVLFHFYAKLCA